MRLILFFSLLAALGFASTCTASIRIKDSLSEQHFEQAPERAVVLNWDLLEQVLALGITPVAASNPLGYRQWVTHPRAPNSILDIGTRSEPNLEEIARLRPDVILAASPQRDLVGVLKSIAPVVYLANFAKEDQAAEKAIQHLVTLSKLFAKVPQANKILNTLSERFTTLSAKLQAAYPNQLPDITTLRFSNIDAILVNTRNSSSHYVSQKLGLGSTLSFPAAPWGIRQQRINALQHIEQGYVLYFLPFAQRELLKTSVLWQAMPFVKNGHMNAVQAVWNYGGVISLQRMAEAITAALLEIAPAP